MKGRNVYAYLFCWLFFAGVSLTQSFGQTITTGAVAPTSVCREGTITVTFTPSGVFSAGNVFSAQLSDVTGAFPTNPTVIGTTSAGLVINAKIPANVDPGSAYRIRVVSSAPARVGSTALSVVTINVPAAPNATPPPPYCEGDAATALTATPSAGGTLNWYGTSATGGTRSGTATLPSTNIIGNTLYYVSQTVGGCESPRIPISVTVKDKPNAPVTNPVTLCLNQAATALTATPVAGGTLNWYGTSATGGTRASAAPIPGTTTAGSTTYYVSQTLNGCEGPRAGIVVTISSPPPAPTATAPAPYCEGAPVAALAAVGQNLRWYGTSATGGTASTQATIPSTSLAGTFTYYVSQTVNGCESARTPIVVQVKDAPPAPATAAAPAYCLSQPATALSATPTTGATLNWYGTNATGGTASPTPSVPITTQVGTSMYYVSQTQGGCEGPRAPITVTVKATPSVPAVMSPTIICQSRTATPLAATPSTGGTLNWYGTNQTGGTASPTAPVPSTSATGTTVYYVSQTVNGCESTRTPLTVTVNAVPAAPTTIPPSAYCEGETAQPLTATGQNLKWYGTNSTGGIGSTTPTIPTTTAAVVGTTLYFVTQTVSSCESDRASIAVQVKDRPGAPGTSAIELCQGAPPQPLNATLVANATPNWYGTSATGGTASVNAPLLSTSNVGTVTYYISQSLNDCESPRVGLNVRIKALPGAPSVSSVSLCNKQDPSPLTAGGQNLKWYTGNDAPLGSAPRPNTDNVGTQTFKVSQTSNENCEGPKATITVVVNALPAPPSVSNLTYCQAVPDQPAQNVSPLTANGANLKWYNPDGNAFPNAPTPSISRTGTFNYDVSQTVNNCEGGKATIQVTVNSTAAPTVAKSVVSYCINDKAAPLEASAESGGRLRWIDPYERTTDNAPTPSTINTNVDPQGDAFYVYQIGANGCYSPRATIRVVVNTTPTLSLQAPSNASVNLGQRTSLQLKFTGSAPYSYTISDGYSGRSLRSDTTIMVLPRGNTTYQVIAVTNGCGIGLPGNPATAGVVVRVPTVSTTAFNTSTLCAGTALTVPFITTGEFNPGNSFSIELASLADTTKKYAVPATAVGSPVTGTLPLALPSGQYYVRVKAANPEIGITGTNSPTLLTVRSLPTATLTGTQDIYEGSPANLTIALGGDGPWTVMYADSARSYSATATTSPYVAEVRLARTTTYRLTTVTNNCGTGSISGTATVSVLPLLGIENNSLDPLVKAYPVPTTSVLTVELDLPLTHDPANFEVTDLRGRTVLQSTSRSRRNELDLSSQPNGLYILRIQVGDRHTIRKLVKQ
ncbi:Ig-like domain-containing protein [Spirosoma knui]